jgi:hypothetical protein
VSLLLTKSHDDWIETLILENKWNIIDGTRVILGKITYKQGLRAKL